MPRQEVLRNVPADQLAATVESFRQDAATRIDAQKNADGTFDVTATFS